MDFDSYLVFVVTMTDSSQSGSQSVNQSSVFFLAIVGDDWLRGCRFTRGCRGMSIEHATTCNGQ